MGGLCRYGKALPYRRRRHYGSAAITAVSALATAAIFFLQQIFNLFFQLIFNFDLLRIFVSLFP